MSQALFDFLFVHKHGDEQLILNDKIHNPEELNFKIDKAIKKNASIGSVFQTKNFPIVMIAVGSLNVNRIHTDYEEMQNYKKGTPCGYFSIGSSMLLCFPNHLKTLIDEGSNVKIGQRILI